MTKKFFGRSKELSLLHSYADNAIANFIVITGRMCIGKSRLVEEFADAGEFLKFTGLAPSENVSALEQREEFARLLKKYFNVPPVRTDDWATLFDVLAEHVRESKRVVLFDEASWMGMDDATYLPKIKNLWDEQLKQNTDLMFIICSSISSWIEENLLASTGFVGRIHHVIHLNPLPLPVCGEFLNAKGCSLSAYEKFKILSVTGGVPLYLESIDLKQTAEQNISRLCFNPGGLLVREFDSIFSDLFSNRNTIYKRIVEVLIHGALTTNNLCKKLGVISSGLMSEYLRHLTAAGFIKRDYTWNLKTAKIGLKSVYRLSDNYLRFYLKYIDSNMQKIEQSQYEFGALEALDNAHVTFGLQFENLMVSNADVVLQALGILKRDVLNFGPYFQTKTQRTKGCQIDLLIQTKYQELYVCEIKFSKNSIGISAVDEFENKLNALSLPRGFSTRSVLIHVNGVSEALEDEHYFTYILDFSELSGPDMSTQGLAGPDMSAFDDQSEGDQPAE